MSGPECVKVAVRIRPMSQAEQARGCQTVVEQAAPNHPQILVCGGRTPSDIFSYSYVFAPTVVQSHLYEVSVAPLLAKLFDGYNATILAYGQTSSGKTFTMGTDFTGQTGDHMGVIPRAIVDIFRMIDDRSDGAPCANMDTTVTCSFIEVYQDNVYDLLEEKSGTDRQPIEIREAPGGDIILQGLTDVRATTRQHAFDCLLRGSTGRVVRATAMNNVSSRSHAIFTLTIQQTTQGETGGNVIRSKFHLVDLAGSERSKKTDTTGDRFKEGVEINKCLLALGNVITALGSTNGGPGKTHIPYRTSKLTRLLQDSLGGNSYTLMIACVSPADYNLSETVSTLRYAYRVCKIKNKPIVNQDPQQARIKQLEATVQDLRLKVLSLMRGNGEAQDGEFRVPLPVHSPLTRGLSDPELRSPRKDEPGAAHVPETGVNVQKLQESNRNLQMQLQSTLHELGSNEMRAMTAEKLLDDIEQVLGKHDTNDGTAETTPAGEGEMRRAIRALLLQYKEEVFALGIHNHSIPAVSGCTVSSDDELRSEEIERKSTFHTQQQMRIHSELSQLKRQLALKEELHRKCMDNSSVVQTLTTNRERELTEQLREYERQIGTLEEQLAELNALHESSKAGEKRTKLAEERRRKVQQLESDLAVLRQKCMRQAKLLKLNENDAQRIAGLSAEIQEMKATRVKLQKALRTESENFRQWRVNREKEIIQLKAKDRKRQFELKKLETTYTLQKRIMQRKMDETIMVNKRLKATLDRRQRNPTAADRSVMRGAEAAKWIKHELELICNTVEASVTLKLLRSQRTQQSKKLTQLQAQLAELEAMVVVEEEEEGGADGSIDGQHQQRGELEDEIRQCVTDLEYRNAQIADLQQKINTMDTETQLAAFAEGLVSLPEARESFQRLLEQLVHTHTRLFETRFQLVELKATSECQEEALGQARAQMQLAEKQYREQVVQLERTYEDKLALLLMRPPGGTSAVPDENQDGLAQPDTVHEEAIRHIDELRDELESYKQTVHTLQEKLKEHELPRRKCQLPQRLRDHQMDIDFDEDAAMELSDEENEEDDLSRELLEKELDPDFRGTPLHKRKKMQTFIRESVANPNHTTNGPGNCGCTGNCGSRRCGCQKQAILCHPGCKCPPGCVNRNPLSSINERENGSPSAADVAGGTSQPDSQPKQTGEGVNKENTFTMPNDTSSVKDDREELDILAYVAKYRKRRPLLDI
ncbi:chromosome-associated kinesin KIF4 [Anopheles stephensi]|uniref:chromosome-associated kinesin KIF4 n=1 Tax=Anopheles stephensi TaxID=30069 RepID=UPI001658A493|nr:chromosome-associated kinesin KIF4 [Anopheles stephensi]